MKKIIKEYWPLIIVLIITATTQIIYWQARPELGNCYDCGEYQDLANFISRNPKNFISDFRPPLYPVLMILVGLANPNQNGDKNLFTTQSLILIATVIVLWNITRKMKMPPCLGFVALILIVINPAFFSFTKFKLTETFNMFLLTLLVLVSFDLKNKFTFKNVFIFSAISTILTFTRFANSYLVFAVFILVGMYLRKEIASKKSIAILWVLGILMLATPQVLYSLANNHRNYYFGLTGETGTNLLGKLIQYQLIPKTDSDHQKIINTVLGCKGALATTDVYTCVWNFLPKNSFVSKYSVENMYVDAFDRKYILKNLPVYLVKSAGVAFEAISKPADMYLILSKTNHPLFEIEKTASKVFHLAIIFWSVAILPLFLISYAKNLLQGKKFIVGVFLTIAFYYMIITGLGAINDYQRIVTPAMPFVYILMVYTSYNLLKVAKKISCENHS